MNVPLILNRSVRSSENCGAKALESGANVLRMLFGGTDDDDDDDYEDDFDDTQDDDAFDGEGGCGSDQQPPPPQTDLDFDKIDGQVEGPRLLDMQSGPEDPDPNSEQGMDNPRRPKLASNGDLPRLAGGRDRETARNRLSGFQTRESRRSGSGQLLGGGSSGFAGFIG